MAKELQILEVSMAWELKKVEDQRKALIEAYLSGEVAMTELCRSFGVSRKTAYKWYNRYLSGNGEEALKDLSRAPHEPKRLYSNEIIDRAIDLKLKKRRWGPRKVICTLNRDYPDERWPSATRFYEILKEHHLVTSRKLRSRVPATHPLGDVNKSNDVWMADFKGWFLLQDRTKCEPLTITDGHSRYLIGCHHLPRKKAEYVWPVFKEAFLEYGLPNRIRTDNGPPFGCVGAGRLTRLSVNLIKAGVIPEWINPGHPEENGRHERFHLTLKQAVAEPAAQNLKEQIARMQAFQEEYNFERPHEALGMDRPADHYCYSTRKWDGVLRQPEYDTRLVEVRKVCPSGCIWLKQKEYFLGQALVGEYVSLKEGELGNFELHYGPVYLGKLKVDKGLERPKIQPKRIVRRG